jgi:voltage-gated potassium channel Kch
VSPDWSIPVFKTVQLFVLNSGAEDDSSHPSNWLLMVARLSAAALFLVVSSAVIQRVLDDLRRLPSLLTRRDHVVICGLGQIGLQLLDDLDALGRAKEVVIVENNTTNQWLEYARNMGAAVVIGDSTKANTLAEARAVQASAVFVVNGDDSANLEVTAELEALMARENRQNDPLRLGMQPCG